MSNSNYHKYKDYYQNYHKEYYLEHKDEIIKSRIEYNIKLKEKIICECGKSIVKSSLPKHILSKFHIKHLNEK